MLEQIANTDADILLFIQDAVRTPALTPVFRMITSLGDSAVIWVLISLALVFFPKTRRTGIISIAALLVSLLINNMVLKNLVGRIRPYDMVEGLVPLIAKPRDYSFPSGHTASSFASAVVLHKNFPKQYGIPLLVLAGLIGLSRLYVGVHFPSDVLFGAMSGTVCGWIAMTLPDVFRRRDSSEIQNAE